MQERKKQCINPWTCRAVVKGIKRTPSRRHATCFCPPTYHHSAQRGSKTRLHWATISWRCEPTPLGHSQARHQAPRQLLPLQQFFLHHQETVFIKEQTRQGEQRVCDKFIHRDLMTAAAVSTWGCHHQSHQLAIAERALLSVLHLSSLHIHMRC